MSQLGQTLPSRSASVRIKSREGIASGGRMGESEHSIRIGGFLRVGDLLKDIPVLNRLAVGIHPPDVDRCNTPVVRIVAKNIVDMSPNVVVRRDDLVEFEVSLGMAL
jgi:hypothetical protein